jgi:hypothetical protein
MLEALTLLINIASRRTRADMLALTIGHYIPRLWSLNVRSQTPTTMDTHERRPRRESECAGSFTAARPPLRLINFVLF